ncbi:MAG: alpha-N-arabinofuranosidase, partial [Bacteroidales bacterium]|nr:alpha-N-arabinofuranosidase [Bacteroidales bacterium]
MNKKNRFLIILSMALMLPVTLLMVLVMAGTGCREASGRPDGPCDIYTAGGFPCVTAHSTTRALYESYNGPLYQVMRQSDGKTLDIGVVAAGKGDRGGYADAAAQDAFCDGTICLITVIYDQSGNGNHLFQAPPGTFRGPAKGGFNTLPIADMAPITIMGHKAYGVFIMPGMGFRNNNASGLAINDEPQGVYMVFDGTHYDHGCCFNYGNTSTNSRAVGRGTMETVYFGTATAWGKGSGPGPWIMSDMEAGLFPGYDPKENAANPTIDSWRFVTGMVNGGGGNQWEIHGGNAQEGGLQTFYKGIRPHSLDNDFYYPMHRKGAVQLGNGGDNGNGSSGTFYEGVMTTGYPDEATLNAVQKNIVAARYDVQMLELSRIITFTPRSSQEVTLTFTNTTGTAISDLTLSINLPAGWNAVESGSQGPSVTFRNKIARGESVKTTFKITSPETTASGWITGKAQWKTGTETTRQRIRNAPPVKINEFRPGTFTDPTGQFVELFNNSDDDIDISGWSLINTRSEWAPIIMANIPEGTKISSKGFYLLGLAGSGLATRVNRGTTLINVINTGGLKTGQQIDIGGEIRTIKKTGTAASPMTAIFVPVSTGPWLTFP